MTSASSGFRPTPRLEGDRNTYSTRVRGAPFEGRATCMTYVCSNPRLSRVCRIKGTGTYLLRAGFDAVFAGFFGLAFGGLAFLATLTAGFAFGFAAGAGLAGGFTVAAAAS
jgi:hypothetical protein